MYRFPIGVITDSFKKDIRTAVGEAVKLGAEGIQMYISRGVNSFENLTGGARRELLDFVKGNGLRFSALCGDLGHGFGNAEQNPELIEKSRQMLYMAKELECDILTTHIGVVPEDREHDRYKIMQEACHELALFADSIGAQFAVETGGERSIVLKEFLDSLGSRGLAVNFDPANLVMLFDDDIVQSVYDLKDYIIHTHAKDGVKYKDADLEHVYGIVPRPADFRDRDYYLEVPLGEGRVDFVRYLSALEQIGYRGFLTIERECGADPTKDIHTAAEYLRSVMREN